MSFLATLILCGGVILFALDVYIMKEKIDDLQRRVEKLEKEKEK